LRQLEKINGNGCVTNDRRFNDCGIRKAGEHLSTVETAFVFIRLDHAVDSRERTNRLLTPIATTESGLSCVRMRLLNFE
jgi:hypothetical protein